MLSIGDIADKLDLRDVARPRFRACRAAAPHEGAAFDQRPGELEATRELPREAVYVLGARLSGDPGSEARAGEPWGVLVMVRDGDGTMAQACVTPDRARELARELDRMAAIAEGVIFPGEEVGS